MNVPVASGSCADYHKTVTIDQYPYAVHTVAFCLYYGRWPSVDKVIDHIDRNKHNNRKDNLREVTNSENGLNCDRVKVNKSTVDYNKFNVLRSILFNNRVQYSNLNP